nr:hypothetical protein [uncultured Pseudomonas sp.]
MPILPVASPASRNGLSGCRSVSAPLAGTRTYLCIQRLAVGLAARRLPWKQMRQYQLDGHIAAEAVGHQCLVLGGEVDVPGAAR